MDSLAGCEVTNTDTACARRTHFIACALRRRRPRTNRTRGVVMERQPGGQKRRRCNDCIIVSFGFHQSHAAHVLGSCLVNAAEPIDCRGLTKAGALL